MDTVVLDKCLAFCQALAQSNNQFTFKLAIGNIDFNFEHKKPEKSFCKKKKKSPSQIRREERRRQARNQVNDSKKAAEKASEENPKPVACSQCDFTLSSEEDLKIHTETEHTYHASSTPEKERAPDPIADLELTPIQSQRNEENVSAHAEKVLRCRHRWCKRTFESMDELRKHEALKTWDHSDIFKK